MGLLQINPYWIWQIKNIGVKALLYLFTPFVFAWLIISEIYNDVKEEKENGRNS